MSAKWSLKKKISASVAASLVLVGCAVAWLSYTSAIKQMEANIAQQVKGISATFTKYVGDWFASKGKALESFPADADESQDRKSTRLNSSHVRISYAVFCLKK